jgi:ribosome-binding factor A
VVRRAGGSGSHRLPRVNSLLQEELADIIRNEVKDPRIGFASITRVETSPDLRTARVMVSVMGTPEEKRLTIDGLARGAAFIREHLRRRVEIRRIPALDFRLDENIEYGIHIAEVLGRLKDDQGESGGAG